MFPATCRFSGADPEAEKNKQLFESLPGHYFQRAVGGGSGFSMARVFDGIEYFIIQINGIFYCTKKFTCLSISASSLLNNLKVFAIDKKHYR